MEVRIPALLIRLLTQVLTSSIIATIIPAYSMSALIFSIPADARLINARTSRWRDQIVVAPILKGSYPLMQIRYPFISKHYPYTIITANRRESAGDSVMALPPARIPAFNILRPIRVNMW
jgi:hypothetical protein